MTTPIRQSFLLPSFTLCAKDFLCFLAPGSCPKATQGEQIRRLLQMDEPSQPEAVGSVKAVISLYGERIRSRKQEKLSSQVFPQEEFLRAKANVGRLNDIKSSAEREKARAESELLRVRNVAKELASKIEESNARRSELQSVSKSERIEEELQYSRVMQELDQAKRELSRLKLDVASTLEAKAKAEKEIEASSSKAASYSRSVAELRRKIDDADEEHVLVELARIEAEKERREVEERRRTEADMFAKEIEIAKKRIEELRRELHRSKELEMKLKVTNSDVNVLQGEMELVRAMERNYRAESVVKSNKRREQDSALQSAEAELKAAKQELASIKEESFQFMVSMDTIRQELSHISEEIYKLGKLEKKAETDIQHLNAKLAKAKSLLEAATMADERSKSIVTDLSSALQQIQTETKAANEEKQQTDEEIETISGEIGKAESDVDSALEKLQSAMRELEAAKASEVKALRKLRDVAHKSMRSRAVSIPVISTITISKSEFEYLNQKATAAQEVAAKKVEAARAWVEALEAREKEILLKTETIERDITKSRSEEVMQHFDKEMDELRENEEEEYGGHAQSAVEKPRKCTRESSAAASSRRSKVARLSTSSAARNARSPSFTMKRKKIIPNLFKLLGDQKNRKHK
ncbi:protein PLASTID MOVEMENT IMPAIRED 2 isoform X2 [Curcuma longa]|uniref:protein PLASTID MOVEMENT IMPAIRED 2 isoform X2 n=1 Tax=Curcuma longa TaxID=136217 RepID=UPI003D9E26A2